MQVLVFVVLRYCVLKTSCNELPWAFRALFLPISTSAFAAETVGADIVTVEACVREILGQPPRRDPLRRDDSISRGNGRSLFDVVPVDADLTQESQAMTIRKVKAGYRLVSKKGKNLGTYKTKAGAEKRERQVQYFKKKKA